MSSFRARGNYRRTREDRGGHHGFSGNNDYETYDGERREFFRSPSDRLTIYVASCDVGKIIGRGGATIKDIQAKSGARVKVSNDNDGSSTAVDLFGNSDQIKKAQQFITDIADRGKPSKQGHYETSSNVSQSDDWDDWKPDSQANYSKASDAKSSEAKSSDLTDNKPSDDWGESWTSDWGDSKPQHWNNSKSDEWDSSNFNEWGNSKTSHLDNSKTKDWTDSKNDNWNSVHDGSKRNTFKEIKHADNKVKWRLGDTPLVDPKPEEKPYTPFDWASAIAASEKFIREKWAKLPKIVQEFYQEDPEITAMNDEEVKAFRESINNVQVSHFKEGDTRIIPKPVKNFNQAFHNHHEILEQIIKQGFKEPSPIQCQAWPILMQGYDLIGIAQTGTGKTLAYLLPALIHIEHQTTPRDQRPGPTALVLAPTRELAQQIEKETQKYSYRGIKSICIFGGGSRRDQINDYEHKGAEIVIATPGRLHDLQMSKVIDLTSVSYLILDEADRMLDLGFEPQIMKILIDVRPDRQTVMMSATWPPGVRHLALKHMKDPMQIWVGSLDLAAVHSVTQEIIITSEDEKKDILLNFIKNMEPDDKAIIFADKKAKVDLLAVDLTLMDYIVQSIHGDRDQSDREQALDDFKSGEARILVATDVASRGLDIEDITHIFNYDFPRNIEEYVHRIGRTGRAGRNGKSITLVTREDWRHAEGLIKILEEAQQEIPEGLTAMRERYLEWKKRRDAENAALGPRRGRGGGGGYGNRRPRW